MSEVNNTAVIEQDNLASMLELLAVQQARFASVRGRKALSNMIAEAYVCITTILATVNEELQAAMLSRFQINLAGRWSSMYGPWIAAMFGEHHSDEKKTKPAFDGKEYRVWQPNASMAVYAHTMEELLSHSVVEQHAEWIMKRGGSQTVANQRKKRLADEAEPGRKKAEKDQVDLYIAEAPQDTVSITRVVIPQEASDYVGLIAKVMPNGQLKILGVSDNDASAKLVRMAAANYDALNAAKMERKKLDAAREEGRREERERVSSSKTPATISIAGGRPTILTPELLERAKANIAAKQAAN